EITIAVVSLVMLLLVSTYQEGHGSVRDYIAARKLPVRWILYYVLLFYVILLGQYGPGYSASEFIYQGF
ncbi:MAG: MBOAT family protein, partial [Lachnospiraceae bacterium]|nr:MBOAT family protein [Lachnospiraceae bacterium]